MIALPTRSITRRYIARSAKLWILARIMLAVQVAFAAQNRSFGNQRLTDHLFGFVPMVIAIAVSTALGVVETHRQHERALLGNLGLGFRELIPLLVLPSAIGELVLHLAYAIVRLAT